MNAPRTAAGFFLDPARRAAVGLGIGTGALLLLAVLGGWRSFAVSYLPAWLCLLALPVGALPVVIMIERADAWRPQPETALLESLRWLLALMPVAALLVLPVLFALPDLAPRARGEATLAGLWFGTPFLAARLILCFAAWTALAMLFARRGSASWDASWGRPGRVGNIRAALGLFLHLLFGALVAGDLVLSVAEPVSEPFPSILSSLLLMASWSSLALSAAILVAPPDIGPARRRLDRLTPLAVLLAIWAVLHVARFLALHSADLPEAAAWYGARGGGEGRALALYAGAVVLLAALLTIKPGEYRTRLVAALALGLHVLEPFWFVTPSLRGSFKVTLNDALALIGLAGLAVGLLPRARRLFPEAGDPTRGPS